MSQPPPTMSQKPGGKWTDAETDILMNGLAQAAIDGRKGDGGFSEVIYQEVARTFPAAKPRDWSLVATATLS